MAGQQVKVIDHSDQVQGASKYYFKWRTRGETPTQDKLRDNTPLALSFQDGITLAIPLQFKCYRVEDVQHVTWGTPLDRVELECEVKPGAKAADIIHEEYY